jgi:hypothetical protein
MDEVTGAYLQGFSHCLDTVGGELLTIRFQFPHLQRTVAHTSKPTVSELESEVFHRSAVGAGKRCERVIFLIV